MEDPWDYCEAVVNFILTSVKVLDFSNDDVDLVAVAISINVEIPNVNEMYVVNMEHVSMTWAYVGIQVRYVVTRVED